MTDADADADAGWYAGDDRVARVREGSAGAPADWPTLAIETGVVADEDSYYRQLKEATTAAAREAVAERERADDRQLIHAVRAMDDADRTANELAERLAEWAGSVYDESGSGVEYAHEIVAREHDGPTEDRIVSLASRIVDLSDEARELETFVESRAPVAAPNLSALAGPVLAARLISLAGGLETLAKKPSGTLQVLGAEDALFAHLRGHAPSPKHGVIYTHDYVRGTRAEDRGSAARALAGKLTIAARIDHYSGDLRQDLEADLDDRMRTIRARGGGDNDGRGNGEGADE